MTIFLIGIFQHHKSASGPLWIAQLWSHWFHSLIINPLIKKHDYKSQLTELWGTYESLKANVTYRCHTIWSRSVWPSIWGRVYVWQLHFFIVSLSSLIETVTKKMTLVFWAVEHFLVIFHQICIKYTKSIWFSALKWGLLHFCTYLETEDTGRKVKKFFFQFYHFCKKKIVKLMHHTLHHFDKFFLTKMVKLKKVFFYIFACIFGFNIGTEIYFTSF